MAVTVKDVAKKAGVSPSTVSRVINDHHSISEGTKKKIRKIMEDMGYVPNITARNLGKSTANAIGVILPPLDSKERLGNPFFLELIDAVNEDARQRGLTTAVATAKNVEALLANVRQMYQQKQVDGFILTYSNQDDPIIAYLMAEKIPFTLIGHPYSEEAKICYVDNDNQLLGKQATEHLLKNGHQDILFITNTTTETIYFERYFGYQKALMLAGLAVHPVCALQTPEDYMDFPKYLEDSQATAAVVIDDIFALRIMQLAQLNGYQVPDDLSLISFNNSIFATLMHPYLTSIDIEVAELAKAATARLLEQLADQTISGVQIVVPHTLISRESVLKKN